MASFAASLSPAIHPALRLCRSFGEAQKRAARATSRATTRGRQAVARGLQLSESGPRHGYSEPSRPLLFTNKPTEPALHGEFQGDTSYHGHQPEEGAVNAPSSRRSRAVRALTPAATLTMVPVASVFYAYTVSAKPIIKGLITPLA